MKITRQSEVERLEKRLKFDDIVHEFSYCFFVTSWILLLTGVLLYIIFSFFPAILFLALVILIFIICISGMILFIIYQNRKETKEMIKLLKSKI